MAGVRTGRRGLEGAPAKSRKPDLRPRVRVPTPHDVLVRDGIEIAGGESDDDASRSTNALAIATRIAVADAPSQADGPGHPPTLGGASGAWPAPLK